MSRQGKLQAPPDHVLQGITATGMSDSFQPGKATRVVMRAAGGASGTFQMYGNFEDNPDPLTWYPLGPAIVFAADGAQTIFVDEPTTWLRVSLDTYISGTFDAYTQKES